MGAGQRDALGYFAKFNPPAGTTRRMPSRWRAAVKAGPQYGPLRVLAPNASWRRCSDTAAVGGTPDGRWTCRYRRMGARQWSNALGRCPWLRRLNARFLPTARTLSATRRLRSGRSRSSRCCAWGLGRSKCADSRAGGDIRGSEALTPSNIEPHLPRPKHQRRHDTVVLGLDRRARVHS
jgi:hypothetical protein